MGETMDMRDIKPTNDLLFKKMLGSVENKDILQGCIKDFLDIYVPLEDIEITSPYSIETYVESSKAPDDGEGNVMRRFESDVRASLTFADFLSDVQVSRDKYFTPRTLQYAFQRFCDNYNALGRMALDTRGKPLKYSSLRPVFALNILDHTHFTRDRCGLRVLTLRDRKRGVGLDRDWIKIAYFELRKKKYDSRNHIYWREFFNTGKAPAGAPEYIRKAEGVVNYANLTKEERDIMTSAEWAEDKYQSGIQTAYEDGRDRGEKTGFVRGKKTGFVKGQLGITLDYIREGDISVEQASRRLGLPASVIEEHLRKGLPK
jgi:hypothetical protein